MTMGRRRNQTGLVHGRKVVVERKWGDPKGLAPNGQPKPLRDNFPPRVAPRNGNAARCGAWGLNRAAPRLLGQPGAAATHRLSYVCVCTPLGKVFNKMKREVKRVCRGDTYIVGLQLRVPRPFEAKLPSQTAPHIVEAPDPQKTMVGRGTPETAKLSRYTFRYSSKLNASRSAKVK
jgi:hypothetical protein